MPYLQPIDLGRGVNLVRDLPATLVHPSYDSTPFSYDSHQVDVITASIGSPGGRSTHAWAVVASRLVDEGLVVAISAGNSGSEGPAWGSTGSSGETGGGANSTVLGYPPSTYFFPSSVDRWPILPLAFNTSDPAEACTPYPDDCKNPTGIIPLIRRGTCTFATKQANLRALGAEYILFYNNEGDMVTPGTQDPDGLIALTTAEAGAVIIETVKAGSNVTADFSVNPENPVGYENPSGSLADTFTQWGPAYDLFMKLDIAAPGGNIFSTYLEDS